MEITDVRVRKFSKEGKMRAVVSVTFDDELVIHDIKVIEGETGPFIAMPSRKTMDGEFRDVAHPINSNAREKLQNSVIKKYNEVLLSELEQEKELALTSALAQA
jgi:stage V sporulation protein G